MVVIAAIAVYSWLTLAALFLTALVGLLTWRINADKHRDERRVRRSHKDADLLRAEHEGWLALLSNLREQYEKVDEERDALEALVEKLREELGETRQELAATRNELAAMRDQVHLLEISTGRSKRS